MKCSHRTQVTWEIANIARNIGAFVAIRVWTNGAPKLLWVSRTGVANMETRLILAYSLIALMAALALFGGMTWLRKREKVRQRNEGRMPK
ncbi:MAG: hypothetical protein WBO17_12130 [Sphingorhabdus sp.]